VPSVTVMAITTYHPDCGQDVSAIVKMVILCAHVCTYLQLQQSTPNVQKYFMCTTKFLLQKMLK
jgi:hypothetical protein